MAFKAHIYVDYIVTGTETVGSAISFYNGAKTIFHGA